MNLNFAEFRSLVETLQPRTAIVLGSGLGQIPEHFAPIAAVKFDAVPGLVSTTVSGHSGSIEVGNCVGIPILVYRGRLHYYEGHPWERVRRPMEIAAELGIQRIMLTNAAGGIHPELEPGSLMLIRQHLFLQAIDAWKSLADRNASPRQIPYSPRLIEQLQTWEADANRPLLAGTYAALTGPCYETPAEILALRAMGADAVGMSTAVEAETAAQLGLEVVALSCITNKAAGLSGKPLDHKEVLDVAKQVVKRVSDLFEKMLESMEMK